MKISIVPKDFIINMASENFGLVESNFLLHGAKVENDGDEAVTLTSIIFELCVAGDVIKEVSYRGKALEHMVESRSKELENLEVGYGAKLYLGEEGFWKAKNITKSLVLEPNQETGIFNEYFLVVYEKAMDELIIKANYLKNGDEHTESFSVPLIQYKNRNQYTFPLQGNISTCGNYNCLLDHRFHCSMEFAFDMSQLTEEHKLSRNNGGCKEDFPVYGKEVLAIGDGEVIDCYHSFTLTTSWIWAERKVYIDEYGFLPAQCGNYVVLKHDNEEYSFYGHLETDSLTVKKGDKIKQGQVIGGVGTTGLSNCPHLHFQLMDGPDFLSARGLPCYFSNIKDVSGEKLELINDNNLIVHAE